MAYAALQRLGIVELAAEVLGLSAMMPQVGQGALAVQCRAGDEVAFESLRAIDDPDAHRCLDAERSFLNELGGGCELPVGAHAELGAGGVLELSGLIASPDGLVVLRRTLRGQDALALGPALARELLDRCGGAEILSAAGGLV
jgi:hydroxymethylbilane synthase